MTFEELQTLITDPTKNQFAQHNGIRVDEADLTHSVVTCQVREESLNPYNIVHGGVYFSMMDVASGVLARMDGRLYVTLDSSNHFYRAATHGLLTATGELVRRGRTICTVNTQVRDEDGVLLSDGSYSMFCVEPDRSANS